MPTGQRDRIICYAKEFHELVKETLLILPPELIKAVQDTFLASIPALLLGANVEDLILEAASAVPELSPYIRTMMGSL
jgi:hypothetical protein